MKKLLLALMLMGTTATFAQMEFYPGIRAGVNFSKFSQSGNYDDYYYDDQYSSGEDFSFKTDFYVGFQANMRFTKFYALQPELNYSRQGTKYKRTEQVVNNNTGEYSYFNVEDEFSVSYLSIAAVNKFYLMDKFFVAVGPSLDIVLEQGRGYDIDVPFDFAFIAGLGVDITKNIGVEARLKKGILPVYDAYSDNASNFVLSAGATFSFGANTENQKK